MEAKKLLCLFVVMFLFFGNAFAQPCYDPRYGYYDCNENYSNYSNSPDAGQALIVGAMMGIILGGLLNSNDEEYHRDYHGGYRHDGRGGWHRGGGAQHHGGGGHRH